MTTIRPIFARGALATLALLALLGLGACANTDALRNAENALRAGRYEEGLAGLTAQERDGNDPKQAQAALLRARATASDMLDREARAAIDAGRIDDAEAAYRRLAALIPDSSAARSGLEAVRQQRQLVARLDQADALAQRGDVDAAQRLLRGILMEAPKNRRAQSLSNQLPQLAERQRKAMPTAAASAPTPSPGAPGPEFRKTISLEFRDVGLKSVFDAIWHVSGINFILDREIRSDVRASIFVRDVTVEEAIDALLMTQQLARKTVGSKTLFIYPKTPQKIAEYQDLTVRNFYLAHAEAKQIQTMLKTILKTKDVFIDEKRNLVVVRDTQEAVDMADKLVRAHDQAEPEVMLAVDVIEITRSKLSEIGLNLPDSVAFGVANPITVDALRHLNGQGINVGFNGSFSNSTAGTVAEMRLKKIDGDNNMLANPRIRVRNREKAKIHIGDRLPVVTTTSSTTSSFVGQTVNYLDVGLKLEVEPQVMLDDDVVIKLNLEVSSATQSKVNSGFYDVGTRTTSTVLTSHDGETQVLAGLIRDDERQSANRLPGLGDLPLLGRLFSSEHREQDKTEIILAITPRVLHNLVRPEIALAEYNAGPEGGAAQRAAPGTGPQAAPPASGPMPVAPPSNPRGHGPGSLNRPQASDSLSFGAGVGNADMSPPAPGGVIPLDDFEPPPGVGSAARRH